MNQTIYDAAMNASRILAERAELLASEKPEDMLKSEPMLDAVLAVLEANSRVNTLERRPLVEGFFEAWRPPEMAARQ